MKIQRYLEKSPIAPILRLAREIEERLTRDLSKLGISIWGAHICVALFFEKRECGISELSKVFQIRRARMSQLLKELEAQGLLERYNPSGNARMKLLRLTSKGERASLKIIEVFDRVDRDLDRELGPRKSEEIARALTTVSMRKI